MSTNDLTLQRLYLEKRKEEIEKEIAQITKVLDDAVLNHSLISGRDWWVRYYNRKLKEYKAFCCNNTLKASIFRVIK